MIADDEDVAAGGVRTRRWPTVEQRNAWPQAKRDGHPAAWVQPPGAKTMTWKDLVYWYCMSAGRCCMPGCNVELDFECRSETKTRAECSRLLLPKPKAGCVVRREERCEPSVESAE